MGLRKWNPCITLNYMDTKRIARYCWNPNGMVECEGPAGKYVKLEDLPVDMQPTKAEPTEPVSVRLTKTEKMELKRRGIRGRPGTLAHWLATPIKGEDT